MFEALKARSEDNKRIVDDLAVIDRYKDSMDALQRYTALHKENPEREYYFSHTSREDLDIREKKRTGLRRI
ncbi:hypothetical protein [Aneurinibacillus uraniidurans]|uniref:hypothetical protein n=1 Tax=Aneurinibacillus uraniidurans TaxID=2966586 RepID=UPI00234ACBC4|nr:hypothetical protein [Aneurinibacillus sp. B1]WCN36804.1 hypothetical protein PO771_13125 [Aneurinibacillus sp. B1]